MPAEFEHGESWSDAPGAADRREREALRSDGRPLKMARNRDAVRSWTCSQCGQPGSDHTGTQCPAPDYRPDLMADGRM